MLCFETAANNNEFMSNERINGLAITFLLSVNMRSLYGCTLRNNLHFGQFNYINSTMSIETVGQTRHANEENVI